MSFLKRELGREQTTRTWNTILKVLGARLREGAEPMPNQRTAPQRTAAQADDLAGEDG
jgi:hypothetical protein